MSCSRKRLDPDPWQLSTGIMRRWELCLLTETWSAFGKSIRRYSSDGRRNAT